MAYTDQALPHAGSAEVLFSGMFDEPTGTIARTVPRFACTNSVLAAYATTGTVACRLISLPQGLVVTNIMVITGTTAASGPTHFWTGLADFYLNVLAVSADQGSAAIGATTAFKLAMGTPYVIPQTGNYYIITSVTATVTAPTLTGGSGAGGGQMAVAPVFAGTAGTQTTPPAVGTQLNSGTVSSNANMNLGAWIS